MISQEEVERIAKLARLELTDEEKKIYAGQLSAVLDYVEKLKKVPTVTVEPMQNLTGQANILRNDEITNKVRREEMLANAPMTEEGFIKVKAVLGDSEENL
jgi:aspartyl-tRNA(Asn)/glutamyl-tRNA(Gln) amidotransferase subunit C